MYLSLLISSMCMGFSVGYTVARHQVALACRRHQDQIKDLQGQIKQLRSEVKLLQDAVEIDL